MKMCSCFKPKLVLHKKGRPDVADESVSIAMREITVRIVHAGGRIEMYYDAIPVSILTHKYPGMCIARPTVFKRPHESLLSAGDVLLPGNKYFVIHRTAVEKLKRRLRQEQQEESAEIEGVGEDRFKETVCPESRGYYVPKESWTMLQKKAQHKNQFTPPIQKPKLWKETDWEPSLTSIQEASP